MDTESVGCRMVQENLSVSIVVPVYNVSLYIERCVRSVIAQTYPVIECIIVDDASPDDSISKCEQLIAEYDGPTRFVIMHHDQNRGLSAARNTGTDAAQGDYIFYLDSDDELTPDCIEKLAGPIEKDPSIEMVQGNHKVFKENSKIGWITLKEEFASSPAVRDCFFDKNVLPDMAWNKLISKRFLKDHGLYFKAGILHEDFQWIFYVVKWLQHLYTLPNVTYHYYVRPLSICTGTHKKEMALYYSIIYEDIARHFTPGEEAREAKYYLGLYCDYFFENRSLEGFKMALPFFEKALAGDDYRKERLRLWVLRLSSRSAFLHGIFAVLLIIRRVILYPFRRLALLRKKAKY